MSSYIGLIILLFAQSLFAAESVKIVDLGKVEISGQLRSDLGALLKLPKSSPPDLVGAIYDCRNYCKFVNFLGSPILAIELPENTEVASLRFVHRESTAFKALFGKAEIEKATLDLIEKQKGFRRQFQVVDGEDPDDPRDPATYWLSYSLEPIYRLSDFSTELSLQENFKTKPFVSYRGTGALSPNVRVKVKGYKIYSSFFGAIEISPRRESQVSQNFTIDSLEYEYGVRLYTLNWGGLLGIGAFVVKHQDSTSSDSVQGYTTDFEAKGLAINGDFEKFKFDLSYSLSVSVFDSQSYRAQPFTGQWIRLRMGYCRERLVLGVLEFDSCLGYMGTLNQQRARLSSNIDFTGTPVSYTETYHGVFLTLSGGDRIREKMK